MEVKKKLILGILYWPPKVNNEAAFPLFEEIDIAPRYRSYSV